MKGGNHGKMARFIASPEGGPQPKGNVQFRGAGNPRGGFGFAAAKTGTKGKAKKKGMVAKYGRRKKKIKTVTRY